MEAVARDKPPYEVARQWISRYKDWIESVRSSYHDGVEVFQTDLFIMSAPLHRQWKLYKEQLDDIVNSSDIQWPQKSGRFGRIRANSFCGRVKLLTREDVRNAILGAHTTPIHYPSIRVLRPDNGKVFASSYAPKHYLEGILGEMSLRELGYPTLPEDISEGLGSLSVAALKRIAGSMKVERYTRLTGQELTRAIKIKLERRERDSKEAKLSGRNPDGDALLPTYYTQIRDELLRAGKSSPQIVRHHIHKRKEELYRAIEVDKEINADPYANVGRLREVEDLERLITEAELT
jgi:hypothetical protein